MFISILEWTAGVFQREFGVMYVDFGNENVIKYVRTSNLSLFMDGVKFDLPVSTSQQTERH